MSRAGLFYSLIVTIYVAKSSADFFLAADQLSFSVVFERLNIEREADGQVWYYRAGGKRYPTHHHAELELNLVVRGNATYVLADRRYDLEIGSAVWLFPAQEHVISRQSDDMAMWVAVFRPRLTRVAATGAAAILQKRNPAGVQCRTLRAADAARLSSLCATVAQNRPHWPTFNAGIAYLLLASWDAFCRADRLPDRAAVHPAVRKAAKLITDGDAELTVNQIAEAVALSPARLSRLFRGQMGVRLADFRSRVRMARFFSLYGDGTRVKMLSAALKAGFGSYAQFHRIFVGHTGAGPREYFANRDKFSYSADAMPAVETGDAVL